MKTEIDEEDVIEQGEDTASGPRQSPAVPLRFAFPAAVAGVLDGKKFTRQAWPQGMCMLQADVTTTGWTADPVAGRFLALRQPSGKIDAYIVGAEDLTATDWLVVREN